MKLLRKNEINVAKSNERKIEIDTGLALARKVDSLREMVSKEEKNLQMFRDETTKIVQAEIDDLIKERDELRDEIEELKTLLI